MVSDYLLEVKPSPSASCAREWCHGIGRISVQLFLAPRTCCDFNTEKAMLATYKQSNEHIFCSSAFDSIL